MSAKGPVQFTQAHLFLDATKKSSKSWDVIEHLQANLKAINYNGFIIQAVPIQSRSDKETLYKNGVTHLPTLLYNQTQTVGASKINDVLSRIARVSPKKLDPKEQLRMEQMSEMDMDKLENGDYDDEDAYDEDEVFAGDQDAVKQNIHKRIKAFNKKRQTRVDDDPNSRRRKGKGRKKPQRRQNDYDSDDEDNVEHARNRGPPQKGGGRGGGGGGGRRVTAELKMEDWDDETQQLLDKGGSDW